MKKNILTLFMVAIIALCLVGCGKKEENSNTSTGTNTSSGTNNNSGGSIPTKKTNAQELGKNITSSGTTTARGKFVVFATNNNSVPVDMEIEVEFYDANGTIVGSDSEDLTAVGPKAEVAVQLYSTPKSFDNYKIYVDVEESDEISYFDKVELIHNNNGKEIVVQVKNNSTDEIDYISACVVFYQGDKVVGIDDGLESDVKPERAANFTMSYPYDDNYNKVNFDTYKVFITEAYSYSW